MHTYLHDGSVEFGYGEELVRLQHEEVELGHGDGQDGGGQRGEGGRGPHQRSSYLFI